jgi:hypothetical protein
MGDMTITPGGNAIPHIHNPRNGSLGEGERRRRNFECKNSKGVTTWET